MAKGGARSGAGRKPKPKVDFATKDIANVVLARSERPKHPKDCLCEECGFWELLTAKDLNLRGITRRYLTDRKYGKAMQRQEDKIIFDPNQPLRVLVEHIGRPQDQAAAKTK